MLLGVLDSLILLGIILLVFGVMGIVWGRLLSKRELLSRCGKCHYAVVGLTRMICPECGSDLREVGIMPPKKLGRKRLTLGLVIVWLGICLIGGVGLRQTLMWSWWHQTNLRLHRVVFVISPSIHEAFTVERKVDLQGALTEDEAVKAVQWLEITHNHQDETRLMFNVKTGEWYYQNGSGTNISGSDFSEAAFVGWLDDLQIEYQSEDIHEHAKHVIAFAREAVTPNRKQFSEWNLGDTIWGVNAHPTTSWVRSTWKTGTTQTMFGIGIGVVLLGVILIVWLRKLTYKSSK